MATDPIRVLLEQAFPDADELSVIDNGGGNHIEVRVTAPSLSGVRLLDQHRRVNEALSSLLADGTIHELRIKTKGTA